MTDKGTKLNNGIIFFLYCKSKWIKLPWIERSVYKRNHPSKKTIL